MKLALLENEKKFEPGFANLHAVQMLCPQRKNPLAASQVLGLEIELVKRLGDSMDPIVGAFFEINLTLEPMMSCSWSCVHSNGRCRLTILTM